MDPVRNPYAPGAGARPAELAGRDREIVVFDTLRARATAGRTTRSIMLIGLRGVGKTVLLNTFGQAARTEGWVVAKVEADTVGGPPFRAQVARAFASSLREARGRGAAGELLRRALGSLAAFSLRVAPDGSITLGIDVEPNRGRADSGDLALDLTELALDVGRAAADLGVGALLLIDEVQHLSSDELAAVSQACHEAGQQEVPFYVVGAGLPSVPGVLAEARSYAERLYEYLRIDTLEPDAARAALVKPAEAEAVEWEADAADLVLDAAAGYPYFIQQFGQSTWEHARTGHSIAVRDAELGVRAGRDALDEGFFAARWSRATPAERRYLRAMATDGQGPSSSGTVAQRLGMAASSLGPARANLIAKGLIYSPEHGLVAFTVPGMADFVLRQPADV